MRTLPPALLLALALTGCGASPIEVKGTITMKTNLNSVMAVNGECVTAGGFTDIQPGAQVVVTDATSKTLAIGSLDFGKPSADNRSCEWAFVVKDVPAGHDFYGVEVAKRGRLQYPADRLAAPLALTLGG